MNQPNESPLTPETESENWFLTQLETDPIPVARLHAVLSAMADKGGIAQAETRAKLLQDTLQEQGRTDAALNVLRQRAAWMPDLARERAAVRAEVDALIGNNREHGVFAEHAGFDKGISLPVCVGRLQKLMALHPDTLCYDRTWGFGIVRRIDTFYKRVEIDFETKSSHQMSYDYAGETLELLADDHLLARLHRDPDAMKALAADKPADVVRIALMSFGPMIVDRLQQHLVPRLVDEAGWKKFWEGARKGMKKDARFIVPAKRTEPLQWHPQVESYGDRWFSALGAERDMKKVLDLLDELLGAGEGGDRSPEEREIIANRLNFVLLGAENRHPGWAGKALLLAGRFGLENAGVNVDQRVEHLLEEYPRFRNTLRDMTVRDGLDFIRYILDRREDALLGRLLDWLPILDAGPLAEAVDQLIARHREQACADAFRAQVARQQAGVEMLLWIIRHQDMIDAWSLGARPELTRLMLNALDGDYNGEALRARNQLRDRFERMDWLAPAVESMTPEQRHELIDRLSNCPAWPSLERKAIIGKLIKKFPALEAAMTAQAAAPAPAAPAARRLTSERSYRARQEQLRKLVTVEIPQNSREIGIARSYGDLRENFEYKAAKEMQTVLMRRQADLEQMLHDIQPSLFENMPADRVGVATAVDLEYDDGRVDTYHILGAWDRDEALGIIASTTKMAEALDGLRPGETADLPTEHGTERATVIAVRPLPDVIRAWVRGEDGAPHEAGPAA